MRQIACMDRRYMEPAGWLLGDLGRLHELLAPSG
jgi:hypothetical protein